MTGAPVPPGADAIVMVEYTNSDDGGTTVVVEREAHAGDHVRPAGHDVAAGEVVIRAGTELGPGHLGVLASLGYQRVPVYPGHGATARELVAASDAAMYRAKAGGRNRVEVAAVEERVP